jgi:hypothetical protein
MCSEMLSVSNDADAEWRRPLPLMSVVGVNEGPGLLVLSNSSSFFLDL